MTNMLKVLQLAPLSPTATLSQVLDSMATQVDSDIQY
jgi:hypothetical protein